MTRPDKGEKPWPTALTRERERRCRGQRSRSRREQAIEARLRDWYGDEPGAEREIEFHQPSAMPMNAVLDSVLETLNAGERLAIRLLCEQWSDLMPKQVADHSRPRSLELGTLIVEVNGNSWIYQLQPAKAEILQRARVATGDNIRQVRLVAAGRTGGWQPRR